MKILIAEDDSTSALILRRSLEKLGHEATVAGDGMEAWRLLCAQNSPKDPGAVTTASEGFRLLITDWMMPEMDGLDLVRRLRAERTNEGTGGAGAYVYALMLTAKGTPEDRLRALEAGADDFLVKPLDQADLTARLEVAKRVLALQEDVQVRAARVRQLQNRMQRGNQPIGEILIGMGHLTREQLRHALWQQERTGQPIGVLLTALGLVSEEEVTRARAAQSDVGYVAVAEETPIPTLLEAVPLDFARKHRLLPLSLRPDGVARVAVLDPWDIEGLDEVQRLLGRRVEPLLASETALLAALKRVYRETEDRRNDALLTASLEQNLEIGFTGEGRIDYTSDDVDPGAEAVTDEAPIIKLVNAVLSDAVRRRASDIHIEPYKKDFEIRYRVDGDLQVVRALPRTLLASTISRIKVMADLDIAERRVPQDGRISLRVDGRGIDLRISTLPVQFGERIVMRVLDRAAAERTLDELDFAPENRRRFDTLIRRPHGILLVTGPTGSGKTTTLYAALNALRSPAINIMTCEDPVEYELDRIGQSNVNVKAGLTFAAQLRAILRQDPDVVLVGEIRDAETAETAFRAALTGHLVLSTLHCNEASGAPTRLIDMGVPPFLIASALIGVVAQRLLKRLCPHCREEYEPDGDRRRVMELLGGSPKAADGPLFRSTGCEQCDGRGTRGRVGVHELLTLNEGMQTLIMGQAETGVLREAGLKSGMVPLVGDGLDKAHRGLTTLEEVQRRLAAE